MPYSPGRRRFVQLMGWAGMATIARGGPALAQAAARSRTSGRPETPTSAPPAADTSAAAKPPSAEAKALAEAMRQRYPDRLTSEELATVTRDLDNDLQGIRRMRDVKLANADEPDVTFRA